MVEEGEKLYYVYFFLYDRFSIQNRGVIPRVARGGCKFSFINVDREGVLYGTEEAQNKMFQNYGVINYSKLPV
jgi:hypothetical protein